MRFANSSLSSSLRLASAAGLLTVLAVSAGHAQSTQYDVNGDASQLGAGAATTAPYSTGDNQLYVPSSYTVPVGTTTATFTATQGDKFEAFTNLPPAGGTVTPFDFASGTHLLDTFNADAQNPTTPNGSPDGPLLITFGTGVSAFGLSVQDGVFDYETFTLTTYNGTTVLNTLPFVTGSYDNTADTPSGKSLFLGAFATGSTLITSATISSTSFAPDQNGLLVDTHYSNDFFFGPLSVNNAPVPEASTTVSFGLLLALGLSGAIVSARKKMGSAKASTA